MSQPRGGDRWAEEPQNLGEDFYFEEDREALQSILDNRGLTNRQNPEESRSKRKFVPAEEIPSHFKGADQLEFFQSANGKVFFRRKFVSPSARPVSASIRCTPDRLANSGGKHRPPVRLPSGSKINSEKKTTTGSFHVPPPHRQSISERKAPLRPTAASSLLPQPLARKSLHFLGSSGGATTKAGAEFKKPMRPVRPAEIEKPLPPLTQLTRESMRYIPRESLAWVAQLPRESATFAELERLMGEGDRELMNEDDTQSFEALELRLKTPVRPVAKPKIEAVRVDCDSVSSLSGTTEVEESQKKRSDFEQVLNSGPGSVVEELVNLPADPILSTPTVKSKSCSNLVTGGDVPVLRSRSEENLTNILQLSGLVCSEKLQEVLADLERHRREQDDLERQQQELAEKIRQRRSEFKALWGISPMRINQLRTARRPPLADTATETAQPDQVETNNNEDDDEDKENRCPEEEAVARRVRFNSGDNAEKYLTPDSSFQTTPASLVPSTNSSFCNQSFASLKSSFSFLQTPSLPGSRRRYTQRLELTGEEEEKEEGHTHNNQDKLGVPTPVALRSLSDRVKAEFARLYEEEEEEELSGDMAQRLSFPTQDS